ncbi:MAG: peptidoglycan-binding protein LysM [Deltaproteobacteria bacterium HGW-Deltaproteobacteria-23]|nr:MAG: peptidoglycan-binding protein LysM [Deltaproteobacteria bacterium HGW-Deltaproteobacteria-23]
MKLFRCLAAATVLISAIVVAGAAFAATRNEPAVYIIKKGDTLWGLSDRFMKDPYFWPDLWARNPAKILNPHFIYPGQRLKIYPDRIEVESATAPAVDSNVQAPQAATADTPVVPEAYEPVEERRFSVNGGEGFIAGADFKPVGFVIAGQHGRQIFAIDDVIYTDIGMERNGKVGDRFTAYKKHAAISHPVTNQILGYRVVPLGVVQLTEMAKKSSKAIITDTFLEIEPGAALVPYKSMKKEVALRAAEVDLSGYIVETRTGIQAIAAGDIAYIDLGTRQGLQPGNVLYVIRKVNVEIKYFSNSDYDLPVDVIGAVVVVEAAENSAAVLVIKSIDTIYKGDRLEMTKLH